MHSFFNPKFQLLLVLAFPLSFVGCGGEEVAPIKVQSRLKTQEELEADRMKNPIGIDVSNLPADQRKALNKMSQQGK